MACSERVSESALTATVDARVSRRRRRSRRVRVVVYVFNCLRFVRATHKPGALRV